MCNYIKFCRDFYLEFSRNASEEKIIVNRHICTLIFNIAILLPSICIRYAHFNNFYVLPSLFPSV